MVAKRFSQSIIQNPAVSSGASTFLADKLCLCDCADWHMHGGSAPDLPPTASIGNREGYVPLYD